MLSGIPGLPVTVPGNNLNSLRPYIPAGTLDPLGQAFAGLYTAPNVAGAPCGGVNYDALVKRKINLDSFVTRVDHRWGIKDTIFFRFNLTNDHESDPSNIQRNQNPPFISVNLGTLAGALPGILNGTFPLGSGKLIQQAFVSASAPAFPLVRPFQRRFRNGRLTSSANWAMPGCWMWATLAPEGCICLAAWIRISQST